MDTVCRGEKSNKSCNIREVSVLRLYYVLNCFISGHVHGHSSWRLYFESVLFQIELDNYD